MNKQDELGLDDRALTALLSSEREGWRYADELEQERTRLEAELAALRADAMRYRLIKAKLRRLDIAGLSITEATAFQLDVRIDAMQAAP